MKEFALIVLMAFAMQCKDSDYNPNLSQEIAGEWTRAENPNRHYIFGDDFCTTWEYNFSTIVAPKWYSVEQVGDRDLMLVEINKADTLYWRFSEIGETATVADFTTHPSFYFNLKRAQ